MTKLNHSEFVDALHKGKGRAFIHVRDYGDDGIRDDILNACLHNLSYDTQCEISRAAWMMDMVKYTKNPDYYYKHIIENFTITTEYTDIAQQSDMLTILAKQNYPRAKELLYEIFNLQEEITASNIIELDGINGVLYVANAIGKKIKEESNYDESWWLLCPASEIFGKEKVLKSLQEASENNPNIKAYIEKVITTSGDYFLNEENKATPAPKEIVSLHEFLSTIEKSSSKEILYCWRFGRNATSDDIKQLFEIMLIEKDRKKLLHYLFVFSKTKMPEVSEIIMALVESDDKELRNAAINALSNIKSNTVRELALKLLGNAKLYALALFIHNYSEGDFKLILSKLPKHDDPDDIHYYTGHILRLYDENICSEATECLLWIYENTHCSICRESAVYKLIEIKKLPKALEEEFNYDCYEYTGITNS